MSLVRATRFVILPDVEVNSRKLIALPEEPLRVCTMVNREAFEQDHLLLHNQTVFIEDRMHDWQWNKGFLRYYARMGGPRDVVIVYAEEPWNPPARFDPMTGERLI